MVKPGKWLRNFLSGKREKEKGGAPPPQLTTPPKEKKRWTFRRQPAGGKELNSQETITGAPIHGTSEAEIDQKMHTSAVATSAAVAPPEKPTTGASHLLLKEDSRFSDNIEEEAAIKIQAVFRSHLARKALRALRSLVKLQALVRGHLVRKQATATLRCMQALLTVQARARAERVRIAEEAQAISHRHSLHRKSPQDARFRQLYETGRSMEENAKVVEMDLGEIRNYTRSRNSYSTTHTERNENRFSAYYGSNYCPPYNSHPQQLSPAPSGITDTSPRTCSGHFEEFSFTTAQNSSPHYLSAMSISDATPTSFTDSRQETTYLMSPGHPFCPNYMANTQSSRAKSRSQSAPKQRPESYERQPSRRRQQSVEGRNIQRGVKMQRSSSHVGGSTAHGYQYPWLIKLDGSNMSLRDSECGSTSTVLTNTNYFRSLLGHEVHT